MTGIAEAISGKHVHYGSFRFLYGHGYNNAFTGSEAVRFNNDRRTGFIDESFCFCHIIKTP